MLRRNIFHVISELSLFISAAATRKQVVGTFESERYLFHSTLIRRPDLLHNFQMIVLSHSCSQQSSKKLYAVEQENYRSLKTNCADV